MLSIALRIVDWFVPEQSRLSKSDLGRARTFVFTHLVGPATGASIVAFLFMADPSPGLSRRRDRCRNRQLLAASPVAAGDWKSPPGRDRLGSDADRGDSVRGLQLWRRQLAVPRMAADRARQRLLLPQRPAVDRSGDLRPERRGFHRDLVGGWRSSPPRSDGADVQCRHRVRHQRHPVYGLARDLLRPPPDVRNRPSSAKPSDIARRRNSSPRRGTRPKGRAARSRSFSPK